MIRRASRGFAFVAVLPWLLTAAGTVLLAATWLAGGDGARSDGEESAVEDRPADLRALRTELATATAENAALRSELDRLVGSGQARPSGSRPASGGAAAAVAPPPFEVTGGTELASRISESLSRAAVGDQESAREGAMALLQALQQGPAAMEALRDAYISTGDPKARLMMLPTMLFGGGEAAREFVIEQAKAETDPELRRALLTHAAGFATPGNARELKDTFLDVLADEEDPTLRHAAIRGLRFARGKEVQERLLAAVQDPSEDIRLAAIEGLASRRGLRRQLEDAIAQDPSSRVREVGECRLLLADHVR